MDMGCCNSEFHALCDRITRETLSYNNPCPSSPSSTILRSAYSLGAQWVLISNLRPKGLRCALYRVWPRVLGMGILKCCKCGISQGAPLKVPPNLTLISNSCPNKIRPVIYWYWSSDLKTIT